MTDAAYVGYSRFHVYPARPADAAVHKYVNAEEYRHVRAKAAPDGTRALCGTTDPDGWWTYHWRAVTCAACLAYRHPTLAALADEVATLRAALATPR